MKIDITDIIHSDSAVKPFSFEIDSNKTGGGTDLIRFTGNIRVDGEIFRDIDRLIVTGIITVNAKSSCYRCLKTVQTTFSIDLSGVFEKEGEAQSEDSYPYNGYKADLSQAVIDSIYLNLPDRVLCDESCKGLCIECGTNLNDSRCACEKDDKGDSAFVLLKELFKD